MSWRFRVFLIPSPLSCLLLPAANMSLRLRKLQGHCCGRQRPWRRLGLPARQANPQGPRWQQAPPTPVPAVTSAAPEAGAEGGNDEWTKEVTCRYFLHGICGAGSNCRYSHDLSDRPPPLVCKYFQQGSCIYRDHCRYEHTEPVKQEEAAAADLNANLSLAAVLSPSSVVGQITEANWGEAESRNSNLATVGAGSEDWVNAIEFVPGQPYCGRSEYLEEEKVKRARR